MILSVIIALGHSISTTKSKDAVLVRINGRRRDHIRFTEVRRNNARVLLLWTIASSCWCYCIVLIDEAFSFFLNISIYLSYFVRSFQICSSHIYSPAINHSHLLIQNKITCYLLVIEPDESEASTRLCYWISYYLRFFDFTILLKMMFQILIREVVI
jgi:hypothetical protein